MVGWGLRPGLARGVGVCVCVWGERWEFLGPFWGMDLSIFPPLLPHPEVTMEACREVLI